MRPSPLSTPLAVLREHIGLLQKEFADLVSVKQLTLQAIELGRRKMTEEIAEKISGVTGISVQWLLNGDPEAPMVDIIGLPFIWEGAEHARKAGAASPEEILVDISRLLTLLQVSALFDVASKGNSAAFSVFTAKLDRFLREQEEQINFAIGQSSEDKMPYAYQVIKFTDAVTRGLSHYQHPVDGAPTVFKLKLYLERLCSKEEWLKALPEDMEPLVIPAECPKKPQRPSASRVRGNGKK